MKILSTILSFLIGVILFFLIAGVIEKHCDRSNSSDEASNYEMYFNSVAGMCLENSQFVKDVDKSLINGHKNYCPVCNIKIINLYRNNECYNWDDTVGEYPDVDCFEKNYEEYMVLKNGTIKCNHSISSQTHNPGTDLLFYQSVM